MRGRYSVRDQAIGGSAVFTLSYHLCSLVSGEHVIFWGIDSVERKKEKQKVEAGKSRPIPRPVPGEAPDTPPIPTSHVEGEKKNFLFQLH